MSEELYDGKGNSVTIADADYLEGGHRDKVTMLGKSGRRFVRTVGAMAQVVAGSLRGVSSDQLTVGTGTQSLTIDPGRPFTPQFWVRVEKADDATVWMEGTVQSHDSATGALSVDVRRTSGGGTTASSWVVRGSGEAAAGLAAEAEQSASAAATSEQNAADSASAAATSESNAATSESNASDSASAAATSEANAADSATTAENAADQAVEASAALASSTSTTSLDVTTGAKTLSVADTSLFAAGRDVEVIYRADASTTLSGTITAVDTGAGTLDVDITAVQGSGTHADWVVITPSVGVNVENAGSLAVERASAINFSANLVASADGDGSATVMVRSVLPPEPISPAPGATDIGETPTLDGGPFHQLYGKSHALSKFQVASDSGFSTIVYDSGEISATTTHTVPSGNLSTSTTYYWRAWYEDEDGNRSDWSSGADFTTASQFVTVYGIAQVSTGGGAGDWQWVDADGNNLSLSPSDFDNHPTWGGIADTTIDGQAMVKIPAFHYKVGPAPAGSDQDGNKCWWIGNGPFSGSQLHPAFMDGGSAVDQVYVGKYEGIDDGTNGSGNNIVGSASGMSPLVSTTFTDYAQYCENRNEANGGNTGQAGWHLWSMYELAAVQMLAMIELQTPDVQTAIASGRVNSSSAANTGSTSAVWRGIYELWGNVRHWTHGLEIDGNGVVSIWDRTGNQTWVNTGVSTLHDSNADGWIVTTHDDAGSGYDLAEVFLPNAIDGTESNGTYADYIWGSDAGEVNKVNHGGDWGGGSQAGLFYLDCYSPASNSGSNIGGRLAKV